MMIRTSILLLYLMKILKCDDGSPTASPTPIKKRVLEYINLVRSVYDIQPVTLDNEASNWADGIAKNILTRPKDDSLLSLFIPGINEKQHPLGYFPLINITQVQCFNDYMFKRYSNPIIQWYRTAIFYNGEYERNTTHSKYGFFTQLVWKASNKIGVGIAYKQLIGGDYEFVLYVKFDPKGNEPNGFSANVLPQKNAVPSEIDPYGLYKFRILNSINKVRDLHDVPRVVNDAVIERWADGEALDILEGNPTESDFYLPGETKGNEPLSYFHLVNKMKVPNMTVYGTMRPYNPIFLWYSHRQIYLGEYVGRVHYLYGFYTQLIWAESRKVGIGIASKKSNNGTYEVVLFVPFWPLGNDPYTFKENVFKAKHPIPPEVTAVKP